MISDRAFIERFKDYFEVLHDMAPSRLGEFYDDRIVFEDPLRSLRGLVAVEEHFSFLIENLEYCRYEFLDQVIGENVAYLKWEVHFKQARQRGHSQRLRGVSHLKWKQRIEYQQDFYDSEPWLCGQSPLYGHLARWLKPRLAS